MATTSTTTKIQIVTFKPCFRDAFAALNKEWIQEYFELEEEDLKILNDPEGYVIKKGGEIFFAVDDSPATTNANEQDRIVGCAAMIRSDDHDGDDKRIAFELGKMAVAPHMRGKGISRLLMEACKEFARKQGAKEISLLTDDSLQAAMSLYLKSGFVRLPQKQDQRYARAMSKCA